MGKFDSKEDEGIFIVYSTHNDAYRSCNKRYMTIEEFVHILFDESNQKMQENAKIGVGDDDFFDI